MCLLDHTKVSSVSSTSPKASTLVPNGLIASTPSETKLNVDLAGPSPDLKVYLIVSVSLPVDQSM
jgi:hypothetical protein